MKRMLAILVATALSVLAADVSGNWKATAEGPNGAMERTFALKVEGEKLTGETVSSFVGKSAIREGTIKGDDIKFKITVKFQDMEMELDYKGKVINKDEIRFTVDLQGNTIEWVAKRQ
jgi:hypothetical protein